MRTLFVNENIGGHATLHHHLRGALAADHPDLDATFYDVPPRGWLRRIASARIPPLDRADLDLQQIRFQLAESALVARELRRRRGEFDVLHAYSQNTVLLSTDVLRRVPSVVGTDVTNDQQHRMNPWRPPRRATEGVIALTAAPERRVYERATMVVAQSDWAASSLRDRYGVEDDRLRVVRYGILLPPEPPPRRTGEIPSLTFVGTPLAGKGGERLLRVWRQRFRGRATLRLVTRSPVADEPGVVVVSDLTQGDPRLWDLLASTDVFVFPSESDKSSYAVLEAMAAAVPVVTTAVGGLPELAPDGVAGVVVGEHDDDALGDAIESLLDDPERRARLGAGGRARAETMFDARVTTAQLVDVLREARERHG